MDSNPYKHLSFAAPSKKGDLTRLKMIRAALEFLAEFGGAKLTFEAVGKKMGMNRAQVRYHFPAIETLIEEAVKLAAGESQEYTVKYLATAKTPREKLERYIEAAFFSARELPHQIPILIHGFERGLHSNEFKSLYEIVSDTGSERLVAILSEGLLPLGVSEKEIRTSCFLIRSLITGMIVDLKIRRKISELENYVATAKKAALTLLGKSFADSITD